MLRKRISIITMLCFVFLACQPGYFWAFSGGQCANSLRAPASIASSFVGPGRTKSSPDEKRDRKIKYAPVGVLVGVTIFSALFTFITRSLGIDNFYQLLNFIPPVIFKTLGIGLILVYAPMFYFGIKRLGQRGAAGFPDQLIMDGIYKYVRNPMYSGVSMTAAGLGLLFNETGLVLFGCFWLLFSFAQIKLNEEDSLTEKFGQDYINYKDVTPMFFPRPSILIQSL